MGSNLHCSYSVADWNLSRSMQSKCNGTAVQAVLFLRLLSVAVAAAGEQEYNTDMPGQTEEVSAFRPASKHRSGNPNSRRHPCAFHTEQCTKNDALLGANFPVFIYPLLFIPFYLSPSEACTTPLLSGIYLKNKFIWLDSRSFLNNLRCFTELLYKQQILLGLLNRLIHHLEVVFVMKKLHRHQINTWILQIKHHRMLCATGEKWMGGQGHSSCSSTASRGCMVSHGSYSLYPIFTSQSQEKKSV